MTTEQMKLVEDNRKLVFLIIKNRFPTLMQDDDAAQEGMLALWRSAMKYDAEKGKFPAYAGMAITRALSKYMTALVKSRSYNERVFLSLDSLIMDDGTGDEIDTSMLMPTLPQPVWTGQPLGTLLTERQMIILRKRKEGWSCRDIGNLLGVSHTTVGDELLRIKRIVYDNIIYI